LENRPCIELGPAQCYSSRRSNRPRSARVRTASPRPPTVECRPSRPLPPASRPPHATHAAYPCAALLADVRTLASRVCDSCEAARHLTAEVADQPPSPRMAHAPHRLVFTPSNYPAAAQSHSHSYPLASPLPLLPLEPPSPSCSGHRRPSPLELLQPHRHHQ
jgi:hypothetical protein